MVPDSSTTASLLIHIATFIMSIYCSLEQDWEPVQCGDLPGGPSANEPQHLPDHVTERLRVEEGVQMNMLPFVYAA